MTISHCTSGYRPNYAAAHRNAGNQIVGTVTLLIRSSGPYGRRCGAMKSNEWLAQIVTVAGDVVVSTETETPMGRVR